MADIVGTDVLYQWPPPPLPNGVAVLGHKTIYCTVTFPTDGARLDYPAGGIPLVAAKLGFPLGNIKSIKILSRDVLGGANAEKNPDWLWNGDGAAPKLLAFEQLTAAKQAAEISTALCDKTFVLAEPEVLLLAVSD